MKDFSFVTNSHPAYIESLYQDFRKDPNSVDPDWVKFFEGFVFCSIQCKRNKAQHQAPVAGAALRLPVSDDQLAKELGVYRLIQADRWLVLAIRWPFLRYACIRRYTPSSFAKLVVAHRQRSAAPCYRR